MMSSTTREGALSVYGLAAGFCAVLPIPALDVYLGRLARGAGVRRAANRHGVTLTAEAREVLAEPGITSGAAATPIARVARSALTRWNLPAHAVGSTEDGVSAWLTAALLDHYLDNIKRPVPAAPIDEDEARILRSAIGAAAVDGLLQLGKSAPRSLGRTLQRMGTAIEHATEDRKASQRIVDSILDSLADTPEGVLEIFVEAFDRRVRADLSKRNKAAPALAD